MAYGVIYTAWSEKTPEIANINDPPVAVEFEGSMKDINEDGTTPNESIRKDFSIEGVTDPDINADQLDYKLKYKVVYQPDYGVVYFYGEHKLFHYQRHLMYPWLKKDSFAYEVCDPEGACDSHIAIIHYSQRPSIREACPSIDGGNGTCIITNTIVNPELTVTRNQEFKLNLKIEDVDAG